MTAKSGILMFLVFVIVSLSWALGEKPAANPNGLASDFNLPDLSGQSIRLSDYRGKVVFLNFWATWCPPCRSEMPSMQRLYEKLKDNDFEMLAVSTDRQGKSAVKSLVEKGGYTFKILLDPEGKVASQYDIVSIPTTFIIDESGKVISKVIGSRDWAAESTIKWISSLL